MLGIKLQEIELFLPKRSVLHRDNWKIGDAMAKRRPKNFSSAREKCPTRPPLRLKPQSHASHSCFMLLNSRSVLTLLHDLLLLFPRSVAIPLCCDVCPSNRTSRKGFRRSDFLRERQKGKWESSFPRTQEQLLGGISCSDGSA